MDQIWFVSLASFAAVFIATALFYECLCLISRFVSGMTARHRPIMFVMITGIFIAHALAILVYAFYVLGFNALCRFRRFIRVCAGSFPDLFVFFRSENVGSARYGNKIL
jgi:hypothetical protein